MKIPKKLKIGGHIITIKEIPDIDNDPNCCGKTDLDKNIIQIRKQLNQSQKEVTFLHEILHIMNWKLEEEEIEYLSQAFYQVLSDNEMLK